MKFATSALTVLSLASATQADSNFLRKLAGMGDEETCEADLMSCKDDLAACMGDDEMSEAAGMDDAVEMDGSHTYFRAPPAGENPCDGADLLLGNSDCFDADGIVQAIEQAGADVTVGYAGEIAVEYEPITTTFLAQGMCTVNAHWHLGAEHRSEGEYDENGLGPAVPEERRLAGARLGFRCGLYDEADAKFTTEYDWKWCLDMEVGETYEIHWPHSAGGDCGTVNQYQSPFEDGVFCNIPSLEGLTGEDIKNTVGVEAQVFTIVNDEDYYYPDLMRGMIVDGDMGAEVTKYTGSTTGTSRNNTLCSNYAPITWQVDRKCHLISASSFDKMCADMHAQRDDMTEDTEPHGARELVLDSLAADNHQNRNFRY